MRPSPSASALLAVLLVLTAVAATAPASAAPPEPPPAPVHQGSSVEESGEPRSGLVGEQSVLLPGIPPELLPATPEHDPTESTAASADAVAAQAVGGFAPAPCFVPLPDGVVDGEDVRCGFVTAPLRHGEPDDGAAIAIATAVIEATGPTPVEDPLLILGGGPGGPLIPFLSQFAAPASPLAALAARRDVVLIDQRGVGFSQPSLGCPELQELGAVAVDQQTAAAAEALIACHDRLVDEGRDLSAYNTLNNARDLDVVREALGYDTWNVYGTSYGAFLALNYARLFAGDGAQGGVADPIRTLTLSSAIPAGENFYLDVGPGWQRALDRSFAECAADPSCRSALDLPADASADDLQTTLDRVINRLQERPAQLGLMVPPSPAGGGDPPAPQTVDVTLTAEAVAGVLFQLYYSLPTIPYVPPLIDALDQADYEELFQLFPSPGMTTAGTALGMQLSVLCAENVAATSAEELQASAEGTSEVVRALLDANVVVGAPVFDVCAQWDVDPADPIVFDPVDTQVPTLIVNGLFDHITPPEYGRQLAEDLPNAVLVEVPDAGHSPLLSIAACGVAIQNAFYADPTTSPDATCATERAFTSGTSVPAATSLASRVAGPDRYATAAQAALRAFPDGTDAAVIATGENFPDALAAAGFAGAVDAPILLTRGDALPEATLAALAALGVEEVHVAGGTDVIAEGVTAQLAEVVTVHRVAGADRFETAGALAEAIRDVPEASVGRVNGLPTAIVATGESFPDAMTGGPLAFAGTHPILLVGDDVPTATRDALEALGVRQVVVLGGEAAVSPSVAAALEAIVGGPSIRLAGPTREGTAAAVAATSFDLFTEADTEQVTVGGAALEDLDTVLLARRDVFPDALAGGPLGGRDRTPILLTAPDALPGATTQPLGALSGRLSLVRALGGPDAIAEQVLSSASAAIGGPPSA